MAIVRVEGKEALSVIGAPEEGRRPAAEPGGVLGYLRRAWSAYAAENRRGWKDLVEEQARNPTLD